MRRALLPILATALLAATAAPAAAAPACTESAAQNAVTASAPLERAIRATGAVMIDEQVFDVFGVARLICRDLTGDDRRELTVLLDCCTAASPTPLAIFRRRGGRWKLAYRSTRLLISTLRRDGRKLRLRRPVYRRTDPLCCPSAHRRYVVRWRRGEFRRTTATRGRVRARGR